MKCSAYIGGTAFFGLDCWLLKMERELMNMKFYRGALLAGIILLSGCASPARVDQMLVSGQSAQRVAPSALRGNVAVNDVTGGRDTNPMWMSNVGSSEFSQALEGSLQTVGLLAPNRQAGRFTLTAHLQRLEQPMFGLDMTVTASVNYVVVERATGKEIYQRTIAPPYTAKWGDAFVGMERLKLANEGAIRTNISQLIDELFNIKIEAVAMGTSSKPNVTPSKEENLTELKRLSDSGLITKNVYYERQKEILEKND